MSSITSASYQINSLPLHATFDVLNCLEEQELKEMRLVSKNFLTLVKAACLSDRIGPGFIRDKLGEVENAPEIPEVFMQRVQPNFTLTYTPMEITIQVDENSPVTLNKKKPKNRLVYDPEKIGKKLTGKMVDIVVPVTFNNVVFLALKCPSFEGLDETNAVNLKEYGDIPVKSSHWSYQRNSPIFQGSYYNIQNRLAFQRGFDIVSLIDRVFFRLLQHMKTGRMPPQDIERTSTGLAMLGRAQISWPRSGSSFKLSITHNGMDQAQEGVGVAVELQPIFTSFDQTRITRSMKQK